MMILEWSQDLITLTKPVSKLNAPKWIVFYYIYSENFKQ